jgi:hypothetical protein
MEIFDQKKEEGSETSESSSSQEASSPESLPFALTKNMLIFLTLYLNKSSMESAEDDFLFQSLSNNIADLLQEVGHSLASHEKDHDSSP